MGKLSKLKYGLIGCGGCGVGKHLTSYALFPDDVKLFAVYDYDPKKAKDAAKKYDIPNIYNSYEELLANKEIDLVSVATPNAQHAQIAIAALEQGKHVHVEKPIAMNAAEAQAITDAKNAAGKFVMVGLNNRFTPATQFAKKYIEDGNLGEIYHARCGWRRRRGIPGRGGWFTTRALSGGGQMIDLGVHFFDVTMYLMGYPVPAAVSASTYCKFADVTPQACAGTFAAADSAGTFDVEDFAVGFVKLETGASVAFEFSWASNVAEEVNYFELLGTRGGISYSGGNLRISSEDKGTLLDITPRLHPGGGWGEDETRHFINCLKTGVEPIAIPEEAVKMMQIIDAIYASAESGSEVVVAPVLAQ